MFKVTCFVASSSFMINSNLPGKLTIWDFLLSNANDKIFCNTMIKPLMHFKENLQNVLKDLWIKRTIMFRFIEFSESIQFLAQIFRN